MTGSAGRAAPLTTTGALPEPDLDEVTVMTPPTTKWTRLHPLRSRQPRNRAVGAPRPAIRFRRTTFKKEEPSWAASGS